MLIWCNVGARPLWDSGGSLVLSDNPFDFHAATLLLVAAVLRYLQTGRNTKEFCKRSSSK